jgi:SulP family sulfate permease
VPGTQHFRNINRHDVQTNPAILTLRIDESLYFVNARYLEDYVLDRVVRDKAIKDVILMCSAVNDIDFSALESLESLSARLSDMGIRLSMSEVKGPVMDHLQRSDFLKHMTGKVYLSQYEAIESLRNPQPVVS